MSATGRCPSFLLLMVLAACGGRASTEPARTSQYDSKPSGSRAIEYLLASPYNALTVEVDYVKGQAPESSALDLLRYRMEERCNKPAGIEIVLGDEIPTSGLPTTWDASSIRDLEKQWRNRFSGSNRAILYCLYLNGEYAGRSAVGVSYSGSSIAIFKEVVRQGTAGAFSISAIEGATLVHEAGHALGLVNNGVPMQPPDHQDVANGAHCSNSPCVMNVEVDTYNTTGRPTATPPNQFDLACVRDLQAAGGR